FVRIWLPVVVTLAGIVVMVAGGFDDVALEGGAGIIGAGLSIWLLNVIFRFGLHDDLERDAEDAARDFYSEHGRWPDEPPPAPKPADPSAPPAQAEPKPRPPGPSTRRPTGDRSRFPPRRPG
ncbi:MAG: hypothetical protein H0V81_16180, partial [Solirubrobacterales bacterium]|nr:hypothetical protein [Solirubrobacterales bacterium]